MQGRILGFDAASGSFAIAGDDGRRYLLAGGEWRHPGPPQAGQPVDFQADGDRAVSVYGVNPGPAYQAAGYPTSAYPASDKNRVSAALLAFFLGGLGIHKFYLGKNGAATTMLLIWIFGWIFLLIPTLVMGVIAFIEFIIYITMSDAEFQARYVHGDKAWF